MIKDCQRCVIDFHLNLKESMSLAFQVKDAKCSPVVSEPDLKMDVSVFISFLIKLLTLGFLYC